MTDTIDSEAFALNLALIVDQDPAIRSRLDAIEQAGIAGTGTVADQLPALVAATRLVLLRHTDIVEGLGRMAAGVVFTCLADIVGIEVTLDPTKALVLFEEVPAMPGPPVH